MSADKKRKQQPWMLKVKVGDVLRSGRGTLRVVRSVCRFSNGDLASVSFAIKHCSWTKRCLTAMSYHDLNYNGYTRTGINWKMKGPLDPEINAHAENHNLRKLTCCAVRGIA